MTLHGSGIPAWDKYNLAVQPYYLAVLVTDVRHSTAVFSAADPDLLLQFLYEFSSITLNALRTAADPSGVAWHANGFLGDGFLIFLTLDGTQSIPSSVDAAADAALSRKEFTALCAGPALEAAGFPGTQLVAGITFGRVFYGSVVGPAFRNTGVGPTVTLAFRLAQDAEDGHILTDDESQENLTPSRFDVFTEPVLRNLKGFSPVKCHQIRDWKS